VNAIAPTEFKHIFSVEEAEEEQGVDEEAEEEQGVDEEAEEEQGVDEEAEEERVYPMVGRGSLWLVCP
jgi:Ran GTPase-activating protein (RanGAP) involved in mRNA processing and transport